MADLHRNLIECITMLVLFLVRSNNSEVEPYSIRQSPSPISPLRPIRKLRGLFSSSIIFAWRLFEIVLKAWEVAGRWLEQISWTITEDSIRREASTPRIEWHWSSSPKNVAKNSFWIYLVVGKKLWMMHLLMQHESAYALTRRLCDRH